MADQYQWQKRSEAACVDGRCGHGDSEELHDSGRFRWKDDGVGGREVILLVDLAAWFQKTMVSSTKLPRTPTTLARWFAFLLELGPKPYLSRSEMELRVTDTILDPDPHTECIVFKDLGVGTMGKIECRLFLTAWSRRDRVRLCDMKGRTLDIL